MELYSLRPGIGTEDRRALMDYAELSSNVVRTFVIREVSPRSVHGTRGRTKSNERLWTRLMGFGRRVDESCRCRT